jgi:hypothetical protein
VKGFRKTHLLLLHAPAWLLAATLALATAAFAAQPLAAQIAPPPTNSLPPNQSSLGDLTSLTGDAKVWLQDLIKINTTNPPGHAGPDLGRRAPAEFRGRRPVTRADSGRAHGCGRR